VPFVLFSAGFLAAALANGSGHRNLALRVGLPPIVLGCLFAVALWRRRAVLRLDSIEVRGLLIPRRLRFDELAEFTYDARSYRLYLPIPIGRVARLTLQGRRGAVVFHGGYGGFDRYAPVLVDMVIEALVRKMRASIDRGEAATFGRTIRVDRTHVHVARGLLPGRKTSVPHSQVRIDIADGSLVLSSEQARLGTYPLRSTPNLLALGQLVRELDAAKDAPRPELLKQALSVR
jgi:hypothetical protein